MTVVQCDTMHAIRDSLRQRVLMLLCPFGVTLLRGRLFRLKYVRKTLHLSARIEYLQMSQCGRGVPSPGADVAGVGPVPVQMWPG